MLLIFTVKTAYLLIARGDEYVVLESQIFLIGPDFVGEDVDGERFELEHIWSPVHQPRCCLRVCIDNCLKMAQ